MQERNTEKSGLLYFLISKTFLKQLSLAVIIGGILFFILVKYLDVYTRHGKDLVLPDFLGKTIPQLDSAGYTEFYDFFVIDSMYNDNSKKGAIMIQNPVPGTRVKKGRNVYFTIVASTPEMVTMPDLRDLTLRQAINILELNKLKTGKLIYQPSFDKNAVLEQFFNGDTIFPGDTLVKSSVIDLVIGTGDRNYAISVPFLIGKTREEAIYLLNVASFNLGREFYMDSIRNEHQRVYMQEPMWNTELTFFPGDSIHLWYKSEDSVNFEEYINLFLPDSLNADSIENDYEPEF